VETIGGFRGTFDDDVGRSKDEFISVTVDPFESSIGVHIDTDGRPKTNPFDTRCPNLSLRPGPSISFAKTVRNFSSVEI
jgi:hypothetical protein